MAAAPHAERFTITTLKKRREFLAASRSQRAAASSLNLQARSRRADEPGSGVRVGFTCSKKVGNAVARNRAKRRLRAAAAMVLPELGRPGWDYVLIGKADATADRPFPLLLQDLASALAGAHARAEQRRMGSDAGGPRG
jgi:ribonuclease P protein component